MGQSEFSTRASVAPILEPAGITTPDLEDEYFSDSLVRYRNFSSYDAPPKEEPMAFLRYRLTKIVDLTTFRLQIEVMTDRWNDPLGLLFYMEPQRGASLS